MLKFSLIAQDFLLADFDCSNDELNEFLQKYALSNQERKLGATTLLIHDNDSRSDVIGYYTLCPCHIDKSNLPKKFGGNLPYHVPAIKLARLAVDNKCQGHKYGELLLAHALRGCYDLSQNFGGYVVLIDVKPKARGFYEKYGVRLIGEAKDSFLMGMRTKDIPRHFSLSRSDSKLTVLSR